MATSSEENTLWHALKDYTDEGFAALRRSLDQFRDEFHDYVTGLHTEIDRRFSEAKEEVKTATTALDKRLENMNELRQQIAQERGNYATREQLDLLGDRFDAGMKPVSDFMASQLGRSGEQQTSRTERRLTTAQVLTVLGIVASVVIAVALILSAHIH